MKIPYTETGLDSDQSGVIRQAVLDTEDPEYKRRLGWIATVTRLAEPTLEVEIIAPVGDDKTANFNSKLKYAHNGQSFIVDAYLTFRAPRTTIAVLDAAFGLAIPGIEHMSLPDPPSGKQPEDWEAKNSPMGPPLASAPGWFTTYWGGQPEGFIWTGPSGARYQLGRFGNGMFQVVGWKKL